MSFYIDLQISTYQSIKKYKTFKRHIAFYKFHSLVPGDTMRQHWYKLLPDGPKSLHHQCWPIINEVPLYSHSILCVNVDYEATKYFSISTWWCRQMEAFFCVIGPLCREFTGHGEPPLQRANNADVDVFYVGPHKSWVTSDLRLHGVHMTASWWTNVVTHIHTQISCLHETIPWV